MYACVCVCVRVFTDHNDSHSPVYVMVQMNGSVSVQDSTTYLSPCIPMHELSFPEVLPSKFSSSKTTLGASSPSRPILEPELDRRYPIHSCPDSLSPLRYLDRSLSCCSFSVVKRLPPS